MAHVLTSPSPQKVNRKNGSGQRTMGVLLDNIRSAHNVGAIFRTADAVGVKPIYLCGITPTPLSHEDLQKTALGAELSLTWEYRANAYLLAQELKNKGYRLVALELTPQSTPLYAFNLKSQADRPLVLIIGNERAGVDPGIIEICDDVVALPMLGNKKSLNVAVTFGVAAYHLVFS
jgi:tRNA G18 (ribose-2'-O)-methylase SpoU